MISKNGGQDGCNSNIPCGKCEVEKQVEKEDDKGCTRREFAIWWLSLLVAVSIVSFVIGLVAWIACGFLLSSIIGDGWADGSGGSGGDE